MNVILCKIMSYYIYKICCDDCPDYIYVGSTKAFRERKHRHKEQLKVSNTKLYTTIRENGGWDNWRMVILEECGEITLTEARIKEEEYRAKLNANLNMVKCHRTNEERKEYKRQGAKKFYQENKEIVLTEQNKKVKCECGCEVSKGNLLRHKLSDKHKNKKLEN